jgi:hypothetical protein
MRIGPIYNTQSLRKNSSWPVWPLPMGPIGCPETSITTYPLTKRDVPKERIPHRQVIVTTACACVNIWNTVQNVSHSGWVVRQQTHETSQWRCWYLWFVLQETSFKSLNRDRASCLLCVLVCPHIHRVSVWIDFVPFMFRWQPMLA